MKTSVIQHQQRMDYQKRLTELRAELDSKWIKECRRAHLRHQVGKLTLGLKAFYRWYEEATERNVPYLIKQICCIFWQTRKTEKKLAQLTMQLRCLDRPEGAGNGITDEMIAQARDYPIGQVVKVNKQGYALCPFHQDTRPSLYCRKNFYYCFACEAAGDVIDLYMKINGVSFTEAVKELSGGIK